MFFYLISPAPAEVQICTVYAVLHEKIAEDESVEGFATCNDYNTTTISHITQTETEVERLAKARNSYSLLFLFNKK
jgi:hypothetical protein